LPKQLKYADRIGAPLAILYGPDERAQGVVTVKDLRTRTQQTVARTELTRLVQRCLRGQALA
jgi:histidyl-tRNA synthetase